MNSNNSFNDKEMAMDALNSQKFITANYNTSLLESATPEVKNCFSHLLEEEHKIQQEIYNEMSQRGWYTVDKAEDVKLDNAKQKFASKVNV